MLQGMYQQGLGMLIFQSGLLRRQSTIQIQTTVNPLPVTIQYCNVDGIPHVSPRQRVPLVQGNNQQAITVSMARQAAVNYSSSLAGALAAFSRAGLFLGPRGWPGDSRSTMELANPCSERASCSISGRKGLKITLLYASLLMRDIMMHDNQPDPNN